MRRILCLGLTLLPLAGVCQTLPTNEQIRHLRTMADPHLSPDGKHVLLQVSDATADGAKTHLWLVDVDGGAPRQLTYSPDSDKRGERDGQWMPDGQSILFLAKRDEHTSLYRLPMNGGEAVKFDLKLMPMVDVSALAGALPPKKAEEKEAKAEPVELDVDNYRVAPDGKRIAFIANDPETPGEKKQKEAKADAAWVDHDPHGARLFLYDLAASKLTVAGLPIDVRGAAWSEDSTKLIVIREEPNGASEIAPAKSGWIVTVADPVHPAKVAELPATLETAAWSADGKAIYFAAQAKRDAPPGYGDLFSYNLASKATVDLTDGFDFTPGGIEPVALRDGGFLDLAEQHLGSGVFRFGAGAAQPVKLPVATVHEVATNANQSGFVIVGSSGGHRTELLYEAKLGAEARVLKTPSLAPDGLQSIVPKRVSWKSDDLTIDGLLYLPAAAPAGKVPLVVDVHGGPLGAFLDSYDPVVDFLVGQGWAVLRQNPRGSTGRGAAFAAANRNDLGGGDFRDIMAGVDDVLKTEPLDPARTALIGYSYGGEMAGFVETKTTRFKVIVSMAPVIDQYSEYGTEKGSWYDQWYFGKPWEHAADAWRQSPVSGVANAKTPFLLIQGEGDTTDPLGQSQEMYRALRQIHAPVDLVTYPRDDHGPLGGAIFGRPSPEPWHGFDARQRIVDFINKGFKAQL